MYICSRGRNSDQFASKLVKSLLFAIDCTSSLAKTIPSLPFCQPILSHSLFAI